MSENFSPSSASVGSAPSLRPNRIRITSRSFGLSVSSTDSVCRRRFESHGGLRRIHRLAILDEVAELALVTVADRCVERDDGLSNLARLAHDRKREIGPPRPASLRGRLAAQGRAVSGLHRAIELVERLDHVHRNANGARLIGDRPRDRLPESTRWRRSRT